MADTCNMTKSLLYSHFHRLSTKIRQTVTNCPELYVITRHFHVSRTKENQRASNIKNIRSVSLIFINSK